MTDEELQLILDRALHATRGPWLPDKQVDSWVTPTREVGVFVRFYQPNDTLNHVAFVTARRVGHPNGSLHPLSDANFIAHAREDVPALVAEVRRLQIALDICHREVEKWRENNRAKQELDSAQAQLRICTAFELSAQKKLEARDREIALLKDLLQIERDNQVAMHARAQGTRP